jgi:nitrogen fixation NifU-like protein
MELMPPIDRLYHDMIVDHNKNPRYYKKLDNYDQTLESYNPLCGDKITVYLKINNGIITDLTFQGEGCAISIASASMMLETIHHVTPYVIDAQKLLKLFVKTMRDDSESADEKLKLDSTSKSLSPSRLLTLTGVRQYPGRVKCATMCCHALNEIFERESGANINIKGD